MFGKGRRGLGDFLTEPNDGTSLRRQSGCQISQRQNIKEDVESLLSRNPLLKPKDVCRLLGLSYQKYGNYVSHIRSKWKSDCKNRLGLKCLSFHGVHGWVTVPASVDRSRAATVGWMQSRARNRMLVWKDEFGRLEWFETGRNETRGCFRNFSKA